MRKSIKDKPVMVYFILALAVLGSVFLYFYSEGFTEDIMVELIGAAIFVLIFISTAKRLLTCE